MYAGRIQNQGGWGAMRSRLGLRLSQASFRMTQRK
jgi:hypothetical protein